MTRILIIEDDQSFADALACAFRFEGYEALVAVTAEEGVRAGVACRPDVVVADWMLAQRSARRRSLPADLRRAPICEIDRHHRLYGCGFPGRPMARVCGHGLGEAVPHRGDPSGDRPGIIGGGDFRAVDATLS